MNAAQQPANSEKHHAFQCGQTILGNHDQSQSLAHANTRLTGFPSPLAPSGRTAAACPATPKVVREAMLPPFPSNRLLLSHALSCNVMI
jgi:hypothetical protein